MYWPSFLKQDTPLFNSMTKIHARLFGKKQYPVPTCSWQHRLPSLSTLRNRFFHISGLRLRAQDPNWRILLSIYFWILLLLRPYIHLSQAAVTVKQLLQEKTELYQELNLLNEAVLLRSMSRANTNIAAVASQPLVHWITTTWVYLVKNSFF